jgi:hypothetical protein
MKQQILTQDETIAEITAKHQANAQNLKLKSLN